MKKNMKPREYLSLQIAKYPRRMILLVILLINVCLIALAALIISRLAPSTLQNRGFWASVFYTITMILDAGCIASVIEDVGQASVAVIFTCLLTVIIGMITFTGAVIGYVTNYISNFIENSNAGAHRLRLSGHTVILNWNNRASEIVNDLLYSGRKENVVVLVSEGKETVERDVAERLADTLARERTATAEESRHMGWLQRVHYRRTHRLRNRVCVVVRQGDTFSTKQLNDISLGQARTVIILSRDVIHSVCKMEVDYRQEMYTRGNPQTVKTLIQVAEITAAETSADDQKIVVEVEDDWTAMLVDRIIEHKERLGKCNIVPVRVNKVLGQILSQFSIMPELNLVYSELFSNKGAAFYAAPLPADRDVDAYCQTFLRDHHHAIPLSALETKQGCQCFYVCDTSADLKRSADVAVPRIEVKVNENYLMDRHRIIILGHNSKNKAIMDGFDAFRAEWNTDRELLDILVIDDKTSLERLDYYRQYPYVSAVVEAEVYDRDVIIQTIDRFIRESEGDTSVLILSDDMALSEELDANALTYLIYVQDIISARLKENPNFDRASVDVVVEILNPKNYDVVHSYSVDNIVISNRYISKMVTQIGEKEALFEFYSDILTYDDNNSDFESKELYIKPAVKFFDGLPGPCTAEELIRAVYYNSPKENRAVLLGMVTSAGEMRIFVGDQSKIHLELTDKDKLILYSAH
ncbi:MAG: hypothetical protein ACI3XJ_03500 [Oscillospiraceae bacterium]